MKDRRWGITKTMKYRKMIRMVNYSTNGEAELKLMTSNGITESFETKRGLSSREGYKRDQTGYKRYHTP
jgi:hypothetical protein